MRFFVYIGIEELVTFALIKLSRNNIRKISLKTIEEYGKVITGLVNELSGQRTILFLTKNSTYEFIQHQGDYLLISKHAGIEYIELRDGITTEDLRRQFVNKLTVDLARAISNKKSLSVLGIIV